MLDLTAQKSDCNGYLIKMAVRRDGSDSDGILYDVDLGFPVCSSVDAAVIERTIHGAVAMFDSVAAGDEGKTTVRSTPAERNLRTVLTDISTGEVLSDGPSEVRVVTYTVSPQVTMLNVRLRLFGETSSAAAGLCATLGSEVVVAIEQPQLALPFLAQSGTDVAITKLPEPVVEVCTSRSPNGDFVFGRLVGFSEDKSSATLDDFGKSLEVQPSSITSQLKMRAADGSEIDVLLGWFSRRVEESGEVPSWEHLILAVGQEHADAGGRSVDDIWSISFATVKKAVSFVVEN